MSALGVLAAGTVLVGLTAGPASAAPKPAKEACSTNDYACLSADRKKAPAGDTVLFSGTLSKSAQKNLKAWTAGDNLICLDRYNPAPEADGSWPHLTLEAACTKVAKDGSFAIEAEFGRKGTFFYGISMGPCQADAALCGSGDPGLVGVGGATAVRVRTT